MSAQSAGTVTYSRESGIALLGAVLVAALVLGLASWGVLSMTDNAQQSVYHENAANQARTAALMGIQAVAGYTQSVYVGSNPPASASLVNLVTASLASGSGIIDQDFTQPTNANVQAMVVANTFSSVLSPLGTAPSGYIKVLSTGRSGNAIQTADSYLTAKLNSLGKYNANLILGPSSTFNGNLNNGGIPNIIVASTASNSASSGITLNGTTYTYIPISQFPVIFSHSLSQFSTVNLVGNTLTIPETAVQFYIDQGLLPKGISTSSDYTCIASACPATFSYGASNPPGSLGTWTIENPVNAFIYSNQNINVDFSSGSPPFSQLTIATAGEITVNGSVNLLPFAATTGSGTPYIPTNYCASYPGLPDCAGTTEEPYQNLQGLILVSESNILLPGKGSSFYGDVAASGSLNLNGGGSYTFGGTIIAENGISSTSGKNGKTSTTINGAITLTQPVAAANSATVGGYQLTPSAIRWVP